MATGPLAYKALPQATGRHQESMDSWAAAIRKPMLSIGVAFGAVTIANATYFSKARPELRPIVEDAAGEGIGFRNERPLDPTGKARIMAALGSMHAPGQVLSKLARDLTLISRNHTGGEAVAADFVVKFSDAPYVAAMFTHGLRALSEAACGNGACFSALAGELMELTPQGRPMAPLALLRKMNEVMFTHRVPAITYSTLSRSATAAEAKERLERWFPGQPPAAGPEAGTRAPGRPALPAPR